MMKKLLMIIIPILIWGHGSSLLLNGTSGYITGNVNNFSSWGTIEVWVRYNNSGTNSTLFVYGDHWYADGMVLLRRYAATDILHFTINTSGNCDISTNNALIKNIWYHVVATYQTNSAKLWINGIQQDATVNTCAMPSGWSFPYFVSKRNTGDDDWVSGNVCHVRYYKRILGQSEILWNYNHPEKIYSTDSLKLWLPLSEYTGTVAGDSSGNANNGTISGATWNIDTPVAMGKTNHGSSLKFNGTSSFVKSKYILTTPKQCLTVNIWEKHVATTSTNNCMLYSNFKPIAIQITTIGTAVTYKTSNQSGEMLKTTFRQHLRITH